MSPAGPRGGPPGLAYRILALAAPTAAVSLLQFAAQIAETVLAARQGTAALTGWAVVLPFALVMQQMSTGAMGGGVSSAIARARGAGRSDEAASLAVHAGLIALAAGLLFAAALAGFAGPVLRAVGGPAAMSGVSYAVWLFGAGAVPVWAANTLASVLRGGGRHGLAARVLAATWIVYPPLAWALMERAGLGLPGAAIAFAASFWGGSAVMLFVVVRGGAGFVPKLIGWPRATLFWRILSVGLVASALACVANLTTILVTAQLAAYGPAAVAAYGISARLEFLMIPLAFGVGSALTALVGGAVGAGDWMGARRIAWTGGLMALLAAGGAGVAAALFPSVVASVFASDPTVAIIAATAIGVISPAFGGFGLGMALYFASQGAGRMRGPALAGVLRIVIAVGGGWVLAYPLGLGLVGHFVGVALGITAFGVVTAAFVRTPVWSARGE